VAPEAALEWRAGGGGDAERGEVEGASEGVRVVRRGAAAAAAERGAVEGRRGVIRGGAAEGFEAEAEDEAGGDGAAEAGQEEALWMEAEVEERWCHG